MDSSKVEYIQKFCTVSWRPLPVPFRLLGFVIAALFLMVGPTRAAQVRLPEGTMVRLKLLYNITTENVARGDRVEFDVAENVMSNDRVVIAKGAPAWGQVTEVKGAERRRPRTLP